MKTNKQKPGFLHIGGKLMAWYKDHSRDLPWRKTKDPYRIWICEIILQQTQVVQGTKFYENFIERFQNVKSLSEASEDEVLLYWKGLGYYSRAINIHKASQQIMELHGGKFPDNYHDIINLKGIGKYTAAAISSICFGMQIPAIDGNLYRVLSRLFAEDYAITKSGAYPYYSNLAMQIMPDGQAGDFNQAMMDLGSQICKPKNPDCDQCPLHTDCIAYQIGKVSDFPVKSKKNKPQDLALQFYFLHHKDSFLIHQRDDSFIWKKLYYFVEDMPPGFNFYISHSKTIRHKLTHKNLTITINRVTFDTKEELENFAQKYHYVLTNLEHSETKSFPKPLHDYINNFKIHSDSDV